MRYFFLALLLLSLSTANAQSVSLESLRLADTLVNARSSNYQQFLSMLVELWKKQGVSERASKVLFEEIQTIGVRNMALSFTEHMTADEIKESVVFFQSPAGQKYLANEGSFLSSNENLVQQACAAAMQRLEDGPDKDSLAKNQECMR